MPDLSHSKSVAYTSFYERFEIYPRGITLNNEGEATSGIEVASEGRVREIRNHQVV